jgi:phosphatidylinositol alpha-mannosyltransferase
MSSTPRRIAMSSYYLPSESKIGAGYMAHRLAQVMAERGHDVTMFSPCVKPEDARYEHVHVVQTGSLRTVRWPFRVRQLDLSSFDIYHAHGDDHLRVGRSTPAHVRTIHGSCFSEAIHIHGIKERVRMVGLGFTEVAATAVADVSVAVSQNTRTYYPWVRRVIPNGVDLDRFHPGAKEEQPTVLFVGTYEQRKRGRLLMEAFADVVRPAIPDARLWMVCSDAPSARGVEVLGTLSEADLADRYRRAWVFCLPSSYEGFGVPYIEALASGTAVVASPNPGAREVLADGRFGVLSEPDDLGAALVALLQDHSRRVGLAANGLERARVFSWDEVACQYEAVYARLLG